MSRHRCLCNLSSSEVIKITLIKPWRFIVIYFLRVWPRYVFVLVVILKKFSVLTKNVIFYSRGCCCRRPAVAAVVADAFCAGCHLPLVS